ncbi:MAG: aspartate aminotransferase family protein [Planctomycetota bacterium]|jgi:4-aminobutyrate aminotransferase/(S)-3-amino-2-methylpropionate transaminase
MSKSEELLSRRARVVAPGISQFAGPITAVSARGAIITDADGRELIDFAGGIGVMNVGHSHPAVVEAVQDQAAALQHTSIHLTTYEPYVALCEKLVQHFPHGDETRVMLANSGAEAVENAIKIARQATGRPAVLCFTESFHGRTLLCATLTAKTRNKIGCGPFAPEVYRLPYPNLRRYGDGLDERAFVERELQRLRQAFDNMVRADHLAAVILEVIQGEGGFNPAPFEYLRGLRSICDDNGIVLIFDEIQSGFCRTGRWAASEHVGVTPDLTTLAKSLGAGLPISAVVGRGEIMGAAHLATIGGTYGGNPIACAAALAAIDVMEKERLNERAEAIGRRVRERFESMKARCPAIADVRGLGAMMAMEFVNDRNPEQPATQLVREIRSACLERGLLVIPAGMNSDIIRFLSPLVITDEQLERGLTILEEEILRHAGATTAAAPRGAEVPA